MGQWIVYDKLRKVNPRSKAKSRGLREDNGYRLMFTQVNTSTANSVVTLLCV